MCIFRSVDILSCCRVKQGMPRIRLALISTLLLFVAGCGGGAMNSGSAPPAVAQPLVVTAGAANLDALPDGTPAALTLTVTRPAGDSGAITLQAAPLPAGVTAVYENPGAGNAGKVTFTVAGTPAGTYVVNILASDAASSGTFSLNLVVNAIAKVHPDITGVFDVFMTTSFQPAEFSDAFFREHPTATDALNQLGGRHMRIQAVSQDIPQKTATTWDFSRLDGVLTPVLSVTDHSPEFQVAFAPAFMYTSGGVLRDNTYSEFSGYAANLVRYYNLGGFTDAGGVRHASPSPFPIRYWGIYNEPNINGISAAEYAKLYNTTVPAMQAADPTLKFVAVELADFGTETQKTMPPFVANVKAQVDILGTHYYSSCNRNDTDQMLLNTVPQFAATVSYLYSQLKTNPALAAVPVWVTENNVNADYDKGGGISACNGTKFVADQRGSSSFFAGWRPYVFAQLGKAGARALYHWDYYSDPQYGEVNQQTAAPFLSYWVDYWLSRYLGDAPGKMRRLDNTDSGAEEILAVQKSDGSTVVMIANHAVKTAADNDSGGASRSVNLNISELGAFRSATRLTIDATTDVTKGPAESALPVTAVMKFTQPGYGVTFLRFVP